ncbi:PH domain-containing protein [Cryobacterium sp. 1639]|uniref:PH domain-containing protein n=1 Tax=Cryobacterium inferilacus TaxID=2866629 RepID=UPI001C73A212|nr:PH domain-containing protein [Cryobacterium sp. 1639]MBX0299782.1 PH domain-containing protein [Cryobacterium sp. 1639]
MTNPASTSPAAPPAEVVVARLRPHGRALFWPTLILFSVCGVTGYYSGSLSEPWQNTLLLAGAAAVVTLLWLLPLVSWLTRRYTITTRRIIFVHGIFVRTRQELLHSRGYDVSVRRTWLQSLLRSGTVRLSFGGEHWLELRDVPDATLVQQALQELSERARAQQARAAPGFGTDPSALGDQSTFWTGR